MEGRTKSALRDRLRHLSLVQKAVGSKASSGEESPGKTCPLSPRSASVPCISPWKLPGAPTRASHESLAYLGVRLFFH